MMEVGLLLWKLTVYTEKEEKVSKKEKVRKEEMAKEKGGGTTCGSLVVVDMVEVKAVVVPKVKEEEKENPKERKEVESPMAQENTSTLVERSKLSLES